MAAVADEKKMDGLNQGEQRDFMNFLHGAKFVMALNGTPKEAV